MSLTLLDWRRRVGELYAAVRAAPDPADAHSLWKATRDELLKSHPDSPIPQEGRASFDGLPVAPYDPKWRVVAELDTDVEPLTLELNGVPARRFGRVDAIVGTLDVYWLEEYSGGVFLPFRDATAGMRTYGAGRYLLDTAKGADLGGDAGHLILDFNFAYHPSCFYDARWTCPLAPPGNRLAEPIEAGELAAP